MSDLDGLVCAYLLDGAGGGRQLTWPEVRQWSPEQGILWVHLDRRIDAVRSWLVHDSGIDALLALSLLQEEVRPRVLALDSAMLIVLRGVNLNPGAEPEDMVGLRLWIEPRRIITLRHRRLKAVSDIREALGRGEGPRGVGDFLVAVGDRLIARMGPIIAELDERGDRLEEQVVSARSAALRSELGQLRRETITLRRYLAPQREVMNRLPQERAAWLDEGQRAQLRETADRTVRILEELEAIRERAAVTQDELANRLSDQMNRSMYLLTVVATLLLPPSLLVGLLGINVGGMPGLENPKAFALVTLAIPLFVALEFAVLRRLKWI